MSAWVMVTRRYTPETIFQTCLSTFLKIICLISVSLCFGLQPGQQVAGGVRVRGARAARVFAELDLPHVELEAHVAQPLQRGGQLGVEVVVVVVVVGVGAAAVVLERLVREADDLLRVALLERGAVLLHHVENVARVVGVIELGARNLLRSAAHRDHGDSDHQQPSSEHCASEHDLVPLHSYFERASRATIARLTNWQNQRIASAGTSAPPKTFSSNAQRASHSSLRLRKTVP
ncbi:MAG: hypothetical protein IPJ65_34615 [Archangiaceae bacterium]|nr:hypothetical protein [Archangiaceae bacterium]